MGINKVLDDVINWLDLDLSWEYAAMIQYIQPASNVA